MGKSARKKKDHVCIMDVARRAGVSKSTALRALTGVTIGARRDARARAERVRAIAADLGYSPSEFAQALRATRTHTIGLAVGSIANHYFAGVAETAMDEAERHGYRTMLELTRWDSAKSVACLRHFRRLRMDGILYAGGYSKDEFPVFRDFAAEGYPFAMLTQNDFGLPALPRDIDKALADAVGHLASLGAKSAVFSAWVHGTPYDRHIIEVFKRACAECGIRAGVHRPREFESMATLASERPVAVIGNAPYALETFLSAAEAIPGYSPKVIGVLDEWNWGRPHPLLAGAVLVPGEEQVRRAMRLLIALIERRDPPAEGPAPAVFHPAADFASVSTLDEARRHLVRY